LSVIEITLQFFLGRNHKGVFVSRVQAVREANPLNWGLNVNQVPQSLQELSHFIHKRRGRSKDDVARKKNFFSAPVEQEAHVVVDMARSVDSFQGELFLRILDAEKLTIRDSVDASLHFRESSEDLLLENVSCKHLIRVDFDLTLAFL